MDNKITQEIFTDMFLNLIDDLPGGIGVFQVHDFDDLNSIQYVFMNKIILNEMNKTEEEVFGKFIHEVAPEAYEHPTGLKVIETYRDVARDKKTRHLGVVEYSNEQVAGLYDCSVRHIRDNYVYVLLKNVTELEHSRQRLKSMNDNLEQLVKDRTQELQESKEILIELIDTLEKRVEERTQELVQKNKHLEDFAYIASHDLQEPLNTIQMFISLIEENHLDKLDADLKKYLKYISNSTKRMKNLVVDLLDFSRLGQQSQLVEVNCEELVNDVLFDLSTKIKDTRAKIELKGTMPTIRAYKTELRLVFQNLIGNALKFHKNDNIPKIVITTEQKNGWTFSIKDNGIGIPEKEFENIFSIFHRLNDLKTFKGTGIGLAHCKKVIDMHNGEIWVESTLNEGSTFHFSIPTQ